MKVKLLYYGLYYLMYVGGADGAIIGAVIAILVLLVIGILLTVIIIFIVLRKRKHKMTSSLPGMYMFATHILMTLFPFRFHLLFQC